MGQKFSFEYVKSQFESRGYTLLENEYKNSCAPMKYFCKVHGIRYVRFSDLLHGHGCVMCGRLSVIKHGKSNTPLYRIWLQMRFRCSTPSCDSYKNYGGRGICVCAEWEGDFENFHKWAINNGYAQGLTLDRTDNDGNYEPSNCRWVTRKEQANNRRSNVLIEINGIKKTRMQWANDLNLPYSTFRSRYG